MKKLLIVAMLSFSCISYGQNYVIDGPQKNNTKFVKAYKNADSTIVIKEIPVSDLKSDTTKKKSDLLKRKRIKKTEKNAK